MELLDRKTSKGSSINKNPWWNLIIPWKINKVLLISLMGLITDLNPQNNYTHPRQRKRIQVFCPDLMWTTVILILKYSIENQVNSTETIVKIKQTWDCVRIRILGSVKALIHHLKRILILSREKIYSNLKYK